MKEFIKKCPVLLVLAASGLLFSLIGIVGRFSIYRVRISCDGTAVSNPYDGRDKQGNNAVGSGGSDRNGSR